MTPTILPPLIESASVFSYKTFFLKKKLMDKKNFFVHKIYFC